MARSFWGEVKAIIIKSKGIQTGIQVLMLDHEGEEAMS
jgi:hypothetical protein